ncbi:MAG TPA: MauE/DoxX family redox-associated membrane protein [Verrucomicrobiae bacterium]|nr:MauE/DoxX family redox-associated membrane protein [Verrucomicrobiae bacterium]
MQKKLINVFERSAGAILLVTGLSKIVSGFGNAMILHDYDPVTGLQFVHLMLIAGLIELGVAGVCFSKNQSIAATSIAWLASCFVIYRVGLFSSGWKRPCICLGGFTDAIHISQNSADTAMKVILTYLLIGSYGTLFWLWKQNRNTPLNTRSKEAKVPVPKNIS